MYHWNRSYAYRKTIKGYLQLTVGKSIYKAANDLYDQYVPVRKQSIIDFLEQQKNNVSECTGAR